MLVESNNRMMAGRDKQRLGVDSSSGPSVVLVADGDVQEDWRSVWWLHQDGGDFP